MAGQKERTLVIVKPDAFPHARRIHSMLAVNGVKVFRNDLLVMTRDQAEALYAEHKGKDFFEGMIAFMMEGPVYLMVLEGDDVIRKTRERIGNTYPERAEEGTIRKLFGTPNSQPTRNAVHASDSEAAAKREIAIFYPTLSFKQRN